MTTPRDIEIIQGQRWVYLFAHDGLVSSGRGLRLHIRDHLGATLIRAALTHDGAANTRVSFATGGVLANLGATVSTAWDLQNHQTRRWVYSLESYSLSDADDVDVLDDGVCIVRATATDESSITKVAPFPSYDLACLRFDVEQTLTEPQKVRLRANAGIGEGGALVSWGGIGGTLSDQTDLVSALAAKSSTSHNHTGTYEPAGTVATHAEASDPHPGYLRNLAIDGTAALLATVSSDGESLGRSAYTASTLIAAAAAAAPVQSVAGRTGAVVIVVGDVSGAEASANKAQANGYASLDSGGKVPQAQIPAIAITEYLGDVASQAAMLALSGQKGDWCTRSDSGATWIITGTDPTLLGSWTSVTYPASPVTSVAGRTGAVTLSTSDVSGLGTAATLNVPASGNAASGEVVKGSDTRLSDSRAPTSHNHAASDINSGTLDTARLPTPTTTAIGGVKRNTGSTGQFVTGIDTDGSLLRDTPAGGGTPAGSGTELQYRNGSSFGAMSGTAWDDTNRSLVLTGATVTTSKPVLDLSQTWNAGAVTFTGLKFNATDTTSAAGSILFDGQIGGGSRARFLKAGEMSVSASDQSTNYAKVVSGSGAGYFQVKLTNGNISRAYADADGQWLFDNGSNLGGLHIFNTTGTRVNSTAYIGWTDGAAYNGTADVRLFRDAAAVLNLRNSTTAQTLRVSGTHTDSSNYVRASLAATSTAVTLAAETSGTGADNVPIILTPAGTSQVELGSGVQFTEMTAPSAPAANKVILYAVDNGAGKTQLMALFASGASQQVAIEP